MATINISLPTAMYKDAKGALKKRGYASISELIRAALRGMLYPRVTENGFTPEFEEEVLRADREANAGNVVQWDGKGSFTDFVLTHPSKPHGARRIHRSVSKRVTKTSRRQSGASISHRAAYPAV